MVMKKSLSTNEVCGYCKGGENLRCKSLNMLETTKTMGGCGFRFPSKEDLLSVSTMVGLGGWDLT